MDDDGVAQEAPRDPGGSLPSTQRAVRLAQVTFHVRDQAGEANVWRVQIGQVRARTYAPQKCTLRDSNKIELESKVKALDGDRGERGQTCPVQQLQCHAETRTQSGLNTHCTT